MNKTYIIAEIGINHNGDMNLAKELIDMAHTSGCDAVKFQKRTLSEVYTDEELDKPRESPWGTTNRQQKEGLEFSIEEYKILEKYTKDLDLDFIVSCWDIPSIKLVEEHLNVDYHKVASALMTDKLFLRKLSETGKPIIVSTGMSTDNSVNLAMHTIGFDKVKYILACTSTYPTKPEDMNLSYIQTLKKQYPKIKIGFSNHYSGAIASHGAIALGAECVEFHITKDRTMYGSDQAASIEHVDVLVEGVRLLEKMVGDGVKVFYDDEKPIADKLRKYNTI